MPVLDLSLHAAPHPALVVLVNSLVVALAVGVHYEFLLRLSVRPRSRIHHRIGIVFGVFGALAAHALEVWIFGVAYFLMHHAPGWGELAGQFSGTLMDSVYFSFTVFSTLGFGDIHPHGALRYLTGIESLTGLVLITWTASFLFLQMQRYWNER
jgi:hypothetical protein